MRRTRREVVTVRVMTVLVVLLLAGCGGSTGSPGVSAQTSAGASAGTPGELVLRLGEGGGLRGPGGDAGAAPRVSVYGDGLVVTAGQAPPSGLVELSRGQLTPDQQGALVQAASSALPQGRLPFEPGVPDAPTTTFTLVEGGQQHVVDVPALALPAESVRVPDSGQALWDGLVDLRTRLLALGGIDPYTGDRLALVARPGGESTRAWPVGDLSAGEQLGAARCQVLDAGEADRARTALAGSTGSWTSGGGTWLVRLRPLLPDETGCADLA